VKKHLCAIPAEYKYSSVTRLEMTHPSGAKARRLCGNSSGTAEAVPFKAKPELMRRTRTNRKSENATQEMKYKRSGIGSRPDRIASPPSSTTPARRPAKPSSRGYESSSSNSNPAPIITDPDLARRTYIERSPASTSRKHSHRVRDATRSPVPASSRFCRPLAARQPSTWPSISPTQHPRSATTSKSIGAKLEAIKKAEDVCSLRRMLRIGSKSQIRAGQQPRDGLDFASKLVPVLIRPSFTAATGGALLHRAELMEILARGLIFPVTSASWKEASSAGGVRARGLRRPWPQRIIICQH